MKILYIDDDAELRYHFKSMLEEYSGHAVEVASSGDEGTKMIAGSTFDLVITDMQMPGMSGLDVIRFVKGRYPEIKLILKSRGFFREVAEKEGVPFYAMMEGAKYLLDMVENMSRVL